MSATESSATGQPAQVEPQNLIRELEKAIGSHTEWLKDLHYRLICRKPANPDNLQTHAHTLCQFGQWYYGGANRVLRERPLFINIGESHQIMHKHARNLLLKSEANEPLEPADYEIFIDHSIRFCNMVRQLQFEIVNVLSTTDALTGIASRHGMFEMLRVEQERAERSFQPACIVMIDLDGFKEVNDRHGHICGDLVLLRVSQFIAKSLRKYDLLYRYGGDEFLIFLPDTDTGQAQIFLDRIRAGVEMLGTQLDDGATIRISISIGAAAIEPGVSIEEIIGRSDRALLAAKNAGRNRVFIWQPS